MTLNINQLRSAVQSYLDDDGTRWSVGSGLTLQLDAEIDRAIWFSLQQSLRFYVKNGGDTLLIQRQFVTDGNGQAELGTANDLAPSFISNVSISDGNNSPHWAICTATRADEVDFPDNTARRLRVNYIPKPYFNTTSGDLTLFGDTNAVPASDPASLEELEILVILYSTRT